MDTTKFGESKYLTIDFVKNSATKRATIISDCKIINDEKYGEKLEIDVEIDGKKKVWGLNRDAVKILQSSFGKESMSWIGKAVNLSIISVNGKERMISQPIVVKEEKVA